ncbi:SAM-dependent methyltransferase [Spirosoma aerolatum]|uniref:SAM-dependent methyltransferase n=1 Tax=Spirosoma aerolatum TaxID=1211326 RepID=UPI0012D2AE92|nr:SAM-dependent methyltransferase [Spirosoma aerolatum]
MSQLLKKIKRNTKNVIRAILYSMAKLFRVDIYFELPQVPNYVKTIEDIYGHKLSRQIHEAVNGKKRPIPWFTYPAIDYLSQLDLSDCNVFEWGSGASSLFFSERSKGVYSVENNEEWYLKVKDKCSENNYLYFVPENNCYVDKIKDLNVKFDIIVIDSIQREECAKVAPSFLKEGGVIILDNSEKYPSISEDLRKIDFLQVDMYGLGPINNYTWTTSFFFDRNARFKPLSHQPLLLEGGDLAD